MRIFVLPSFQTTFLEVIGFCPLPSPLPRGEGTDCRKSDNGWFSTIIPSPCGRGLGRERNPRMSVSFFLMANLPVSFSQTMCVRFSGERSSETYLAAVVFYVFLLVAWVMRVCVAIFSDDVFLRLLGFALSLALSHGERGRIAESPIMVGFSTIIPSPTGRGDRLQKIR